MVNEYVHDLRTWMGHRMMMRVRPGTGDVQVIHSVVTGDEYGLRGRKLEGFALDVGAHIGSATVPLVIDNPKLKVIAVEPVPENADLLKQNVELNFDQDVAYLDPRVVIDTRALYTPVVMYGWRGSHNYWVGNLDEGNFEHTLLVGETSLSELLDEYDIDRLALLKVDCEGYEWGLFRDEAIDRADLIVGEFHDDIYRRGKDRVHDMLDATHDVTIREWTFTATLR